MATAFGGFVIIEKDWHHISILLMALHWPAEGTEGMGQHQTLAAGSLETKIVLFSLCSTRLKH